jgi:hypothetical protein
MSQKPASSRIHLPAPCIVDTGTVVDKRDMQRLLSDLSRVRYYHLQGSEVLGTGEGCVLEVFSDPQSATLVANHTLYINVCSFDYLQLSQLPDRQTCFDLTQDDLQLRLIPLSNPLQSRPDRPFNTAALEAVVADVLSASWDAQLDDDESEEL